MKKNVIIFTLILLIIIVICIVGINLNSKTSRAIIKYNNEYEQYLKKEETYGTDVITLINKATSSNEKNNITKDEKGFYISNNENSITIDLIMITDETKQETTTYKMEAISKVGITEFLKNFNTAKFQCTKTQYHKQTGRIAHIELTQLYE